MIRLALILALLAAPSMAQVRQFNCVGAAELDDDAFAIAFPARGNAVGEAARSPLRAAAELARGAPARNICVLGHALATEGGATTGAQLAARRARAVALELSRLGIERDRIRAEARVAGFTRSSAARPSRGATIVVLP